MSLSLSFAQGFIATDFLFLHILFNVCFRYGDSLGEGIASKVEGLHPTDACADARKSATICSVESGKRRLREDPTRDFQN
jgi:hypothetical protein